MLVHAVAGVDDGNLKIAREHLRRAGGRMAYDDAVRSERLERLAGIHQRLAFFDAGGGGADHRSVRAQQFSGKLKRDARTRGGFIEKERNAFSAEQRTRL